MGEPTVRFFDNIAARGEHLLPEKYDGTIRFDLSEHERTDHWLITIHRGDVSVSRRIAEADCVVHAGHAVFDRLAAGEENWAPPIFRGALVVEGDIRLLAAFRRLLPGSPGAHHPRDFAPARR
jgi:hypothetical protein